MNKTTGIKAMENEGYPNPIEGEKKLQKTEYNWWSTPLIILFITVSTSTLDGLCMFDVLDEAMTQAAYMGVVVSFGVALILNMLPLLTGRFAHQAIYKIKRGALTLAIASAVAFLLLYGATVYLRFAYMDHYGNSSAAHIVNQLATGNGGGIDNSTDFKGLAVTILLSMEPLVTSIVNGCLGFLTDDELRDRINYLREYRLGLAEREKDLNAYLTTAEQPEAHYARLLAYDAQRKKAAEEEIIARCDILKARARVYLAEYLRDPAGASYVTASLDNEGEEAVYNHMADREGVSVQIPLHHEESSDNALTAVQYN